MLEACATQGPNKSAYEHAPFPLNKCAGEAKTECVARIFSDDRAIPRRDPDAFPPHYLELFDPAMRASDCGLGGTTGEAPRECEDRLKRVSDYFNPDGRVPTPGEFGVALEGGGSKAAPFALGTLAGLQELGLLGTQVGAISSISGGSYAASYYYNRLYDQQYRSEDAGNPDDWFRSCIPDHFVVRASFATLRGIESVNCCKKGWVDSHRF